MQPAQQQAQCGREKKQPKRPGLGDDRLWPDGRTQSEAQTRGKTTAQPQQILFARFPGGERRIFFQQHPPATGNQQRD